MKQSAAEAQRWLKQAQHDLVVAKKNLENKFYADSCYSAEQAAQKAFKSYLYFRGERFVTEHSIKELAGRSAKHQPDFKKLIDIGRILDQYYIPTRYPDALAFPAIPFESYSATEAREAVQIAEEILTIVKKVTAA